MKQTNSARRFFALLGVDFYKLWRSVAFYVVFGIMILMRVVDIIVTFVANGFMEDYLGAEENLSHVNPMFASSLSYGGIGLYLIIFFAIFLCSEFRTNTIRNKVTLGCSRTCVYFSSLTFTYLVSLMAIAASCLVNFALGVPMLGWQHTEYDLKCALYALFALLPLIALIHSIAYGSKSMGITLGVGLPVIIILPAILSLISMFVYFSDGIEWFIRIFFMALAEYIPMALADGGEVLPYLALNASLSYILWTALFIVIGYFSFVKQDIK